MQFGNLEILNVIIFIKKLVKAGLVLTISMRLF